MTREQLALKIWNAQCPLAVSAERYGLTRREVRDLADLGCKLQAQKNPAKPNRRRPPIPFKEALPVILEMVEAGATWREIAEATGRSIDNVFCIVKRRGIVKPDGRRRSHELGQRVRGGTEEGGRSCG